MSRLMLTVAEEANCGMNIMRQHSIYIRTYFTSCMLVARHTHLSLPQTITEVKKSFHLCARMNKQTSSNADINEVARKKRQPTTSTTATALPGPASRARALKRAASHQQKLLQPLPRPASRMRARKRYMHWWVNCFYCFQRARAPLPAR